MSLYLNTLCAILVQKMNVIAKISCYFSAVSLHKLHKEYLNTVIYNAPILL